MQVIKREVVKQGMKPVTTMDEIDNELFAYSEGPVGGAPHFSIIGKLRLASRKHALVNHICICVI